jgi:hypothetical protein
VGGTATAARRRAAAVTLLAGALAVCETVGPLTRSVMRLRGCSLGCCVGGGDREQTQDLPRAVVLGGRVQWRKGSSPRRRREEGLGAPAKAIERGRAKPPQGGLGSASQCRQGGPQRARRACGSLRYWLGRGAEGAAPVLNAASQ